MDYKQAVEKFPKTVKAIEAYVLKNHEDHIRKLAQDEKLDVKSMLDEQAVIDLVGMTIEYSPNSLFEFFDSHNIKIVIMPHPEEDSLWLYYSTVNKASKTAESRAKAADLAIEDAMSIYENKQS